jgi:hypothetical protein
MVIEIFKPIDFKNEPLDLCQLDKETGQHWQYASSGKAALYHCLKSLNVRGRILVPVYICSSILEPITKLGLTYSCYDINSDDLNANLIDIEAKIINEQICCVLIASMYGNPAKMTEIELLCKKYNVLMIDDAAQSFGATYDDRFVGTFGDAGFFSFSPGKATSGHLGAFFWTKNENYSINRTNHYLLHKLAFWDFHYNRFHIYKFRKFKVFKILLYLKFGLFKFFDLYNDKINEFEKPIIGGIIIANKKQTFRLEMLQKLKEINFPPNIVLLTLGNQDSNNHKIVLRCSDMKLAFSLRNAFLEKKIYASFGYKLINDGLGCPNAKAIESKIIELPLEENKNRMYYLVENLKYIIKV